VWVSAKVGTWRVSLKAVCAVPGRVCSTAAIAALWTCLFYSSQCCPLDLSLLQQPVLPPGRVSPTAVCSVPGRVCVSVLQQSVLSLLGSGLQLLVLHLDVCVQHQPVLCQDVYSIAYMQQHVLHLYCLSYCIWKCLSTRALCCTCTCLSTRALCCTWTCLPTIALCCTRTCLSTRACAASVRVCL
jgi:hypothetical protein